MLLERRGAGKEENGGRVDVRGWCRAIGEGCFMRLVRVIDVLVASGGVASDESSETR